VPHAIEVPGPFGCWIKTGKADYVVYQQRTTHHHQNHIILHEVGHILAGHDAAVGSAAPGVAEGPYPEIARQPVRLALFRNSFSNRQEREAETIATMIMQRASVLDRIGGRVGRVKSSDAPVNHIAAVLADPDVWL